MHYFNLLLLYDLDFSVCFFVPFIYLFYLFIENYTHYEKYGIQHRYSLQ